MHEDIIYNVCQVKDSAHKSCLVQKIEDYDLNLNAGAKKTDNVFSIQAFNTGFRVISADIDNKEIWPYWNGCIFIDLDSKKAPGNHNADFWNRFENNLVEFLTLNYHDNFYWLQRSTSGSSFHICFYYKLDDDDKNLETFISLHKYSTDIIKSACDLMKLSEWKTADGVFDNHQGNPVQLLFINTSPIIYNPMAYNEFGAFGFINLGNIQLVKTESLDKIKCAKITQKSNKWSIKPGISYQSDIDWSYDSRWRFIKVLAEYFAGDKTKSFECFKQVIPIMIQQGHGKTQNKSKYLEKQFYAQFDTIFNAKYNLNKKFVIFCEDKFGFDFDIEDEPDLDEFSEFAPDEIINLGKDEYISQYYDKIIDKVESDKNVFIKGGCGIGKSYFFKKLIQSKQKVIIVCHLNSIKNSVYANEICGEDNPFNIKIPTTTELNRITTLSQLPDKMILGWDQFALVCEKNWPLDDYYKCFDEIHNFVTTLSYRHKTTFKVIKNKTLQNKCILVSATPCGEFNAFCSECYKIEFTKNKDYIVDYKYITFDNEKTSKRLSVTFAINKIVKNLIEKKLADKICIFDNHNHKKYAEYWRNYACHYYKGNRNKGSMKKLAKTNILDEDIFITTVYGTEGIEIKNKINKLVVLIPLQDITDTLVEQLINRFRYKNDVTVMFFDADIKQKQPYDVDIQNVMKDIINGIKANNPEYDHWIEKENAYISSWLYWPNTEIKEYIDTFPKMVMIFHNYLFSHLLTVNNIFSKYNIQQINYLTYKEEDKVENNKLAAKLLAKFPAFAFEKYDDADCEEMLNQFVTGNQKVNYDDIKSLRKYVNKLQNILRSFGGDDYIKSIWNDSSSDNISRIQNTTEGRFLVKLMQAFTDHGIFRMSTLERFIKVRKTLTSETLVDKQKEQQLADLKFYQKQINRLQVKDNIEEHNIFNALYHELKTAEFNTMGLRIKKIKFVLIADESIGFACHEECYNYLTEKQMVTCNLNCYIKKGNWKKFFKKT